MNTAEAHRYCARMSALPELLALIRQACREAGIEQAAPHVELVLEELFTNTVRHGYGGDCDAPVWMRVAIGSGTLYITYQDAAPAYNPLAEHIEAGTHAPKRPGGLGILLIRKLARSIAYERADDRNVLTLTFGAAGS